MKLIVCLTLIYDYKRQLKNIFLRVVNRENIASASKLLSSPHD
jgi:hypothetical protein